MNQVLPYINRELSWLEFNQRVLDQAFIKDNRLLERVKFLAICANNLDEFMTVRVGGLKFVEQERPTKLDIAGLTASQQLKKIRKRVRKMYRSQSECLQELESLLTQNGITRLRPEDLSDSQFDHLKKQFRDELSATVSPLSVENSYGFPMLAGERLCLCVRLKPADDQVLLPAGRTPTTAERGGEADSRYALVPMARSLQRLWVIPGSESYTYMYLEEVFGLFLSEMFGGQEVLEWVPFRVTRNGDVAIDSDNQSDLLINMQEMLKARESSPCVRLEVCDSASDEMKAFLCSAVEAEPDDVYWINGPLALSDLFGISGLKGYSQLKDEPWPPQPVPGLTEPSELFNQITKSDQLLIHPYQSYDPVVDFLRLAAEDPQVIAIKQTMYRASEDSAIAQALETAAANGKNVTCIVELKARFDEARNIAWAKRLEYAGVDVVYGVQGLKVHAKVCIVVRRENTGIKRYVHFGTGNYNESTAKLYGDISLLTCDEQLGMDAVHFFNAITGLSVPQTLGKIAAAPINLRESLLELISIEIVNAKREGTGEIIVKLNSLVDKELIDALYKASAAGVKVKLNIRGICCLLPGQKGVSENIRVVSVVDRFLEHARVFYFRHGGDDRVFISSADWMGRNLDRRVELMVPVEDPSGKKRLLQMLNAYFDDNQNASKLSSEGCYTRVKKKGKAEKFRSQDYLYRDACQRYQHASDPRTTVFEPIRKSRDS